MIYTPLFEALPDIVKHAVLRDLKQGLSDNDATFAHISKAEKRVIREILAETLQLEF
jgi:hypothetical protein